jgi:CHAT domain-containing protein
VAVKDLFDFRVKASHISLLACASAVQRFQAGDEPLGLVTAFLAAGATSVLGTLWPVQSLAARLFSEYFYTHLLQSTQEEYGVYDLAYATREAVLDVKQRWEFRQPYHWASFVLHGAWFFNGGLNSR